MRYCVILPGIRCYWHLAHTSVCMLLPSQVLRELFRKRFMSVCFQTHFRLGGHLSTEYSQYLQKQNPKLLTCDIQPSTNTPAPKPLLRPCTTSLRAVCSPAAHTKREPGWAPLRWAEGSVLPCVHRSVGSGSAGNTTQS